MQKIIAGLAAVFIIATAMTGIATASTIVATDINGVETHTFAPGEGVYVKGWDLPSDTPVDVYVTTNAVWNIDDDITAVALPGFPITTTPTEVSGNKLLGTVSNDGADCDIPFSGQYDIVYDTNRNGKFDGVSTEPVDYVQCTGFETIPEFATIAIPAAAIIGLFLFFNHRKREKE